MKEKLQSLLKYIPFIGTGLILAGSAGATTSTIETIPTDLGAVLSTVVQAVISTFITFITANLPLIVVLSVTVGLVFWLIRKVRSALTGR